MTHLNRGGLLRVVLALVLAPTVNHVAVAAQSFAVRQRMEGEQLFRSYCAACHGADGRGNGPAASALKTPPADLTLIARRNGNKFPRERVTRYVAEGEPLVPAHGSREMPVWGPNFLALAPGSHKPVNERINAVVAYVESIQAPE